jgi:hypothetical protein
VSDSATYAIDPVAAGFHNDHESWFKLLTGSVGVGKTWSSIWDLVFHACRAVPPAQRHFTGERKAKYLIARKTYPRLETTTLASLQAIFKKTIRVQYGYPIYATVVVPDPFNPSEHIDIEFVLMAISSAEDEQELAKLRSLELTGAYVNEIDEYDTGNIVSKIFDRCRRFPAAVKAVNPGTGVLEDVLGNNGKPVGYTGDAVIVADYNKPEDEHWLCLWHRNEHDERPKGVAFYDYPSPLLEVKDTSGTVVSYTPNPEAASFVSKQPSGITYWLEKVETSKHDPMYIQRMILNRYGSVSHGAGVFQNFDRARHVLPARVVVDAHRHIVIGFDHSGLNPAMSVMQVGTKGIIVVDELVAFDTPPDDFLHAVFVPWFVNQKWKRADVEIVCDPADPRGRSIGGSMTMVQALHKLGFTRAHPAPGTWGRDPKRMIRNVNEALSRGMLFLNPANKWTNEAFGGRYAYRRLKSSINATSAEPTKNEWSHIADAVQLGVNMIRLGAGGVGATHQGVSFGEGVI